MTTVMSGLWDVLVLMLMLPFGIALYVIGALVAELVREWLSPVSKRQRIMAQEQYKAWRARRAIDQLYQRAAQEVRRMGR